MLPRLLAAVLAVLPTASALAGAGPVPITAAVSLDAATGQPAGEGKYPAWQVADDDAKTAWVANGKRLLLGFPAAEVIAVELIPGYAKSAALWSSNRRVLALRFRFYLEKGGPPTAWQIAKLAPPERFTRAHAAVVTFDANPGARAVALELEVTEATPKTKSDDICVSLVRIQASHEPRCPKDERWRYLDTVAGPSVEIGDRLEADFDAIDFAACTARHEGTGGGTKTFTGTCKKVKDGVRFDGTTSVFDGVGADAPAPYHKTLSVRRFGCGIAVIDGHVWTR